MFDHSKATAPSDSLELEIVKHHPDVFAPDFEFWLADNWHIWREFAKQAVAVFKRGVRVYSARTIIHWMRHHTALTEVSGEPWKINNNVSPDLARLFALRYPAMKSLFEFRTVPNSTRRAA